MRLQSHYSAEVVSVPIGVVRGEHFVPVESIDESFSGSTQTHWVEMSDWSANNSPVDFVGVLGQFVSLAFDSSFDIGVDWS